MSVELLELAARIIEFRNRGHATITPEHVSDFYLLAEKFQDAILEVLSVAFPNPLWIELGEGKVLISRFAVPEGNGLVFAASEIAREVGEFVDVPDKKRAAELGEVLILCGNIESARVLQQQATEVVRAFELRALAMREARKGTE